MRSYHTLMRYSLRSLMIAVTLICVVLGSVLGWIRYERARIRHKGEVISAMYAKGAKFGTSLHSWESDKALETWRGNERVEYIVLCDFDGRPGKNNAKDVATMVATFPNMRDVGFADYKVTGEELRLLSKLQKLEKLWLLDCPVDEDELQWLAAHRRCCC